MSRDPASNQLNDYKKSTKGNPPVLLTGNGAPIANKKASLSVGPRGPLLLQDFVQLEEIAHFNREKIPDRVVHAKGAGAFGYFEVTHDITQYTKLKVFSKIGKKTATVVRFSQGGSSKGAPDLVRDLRGFATKFYTEEGIWDLVSVNIAVNFGRDALLFPSLIHSQKKNPVTNLRDSDMFWDYLSLRPESIHALMMIFGDRGIPDGYTHMDGFAGHAFKLLNDKNEIVYAKFTWKTNQKIKNLSQEKAAKISIQEPDYSIRKLYNAIARGEFPSWTLYIQVMTVEQTRRFRFNPFDITKVWSHRDFPLIPVGRLVLNRNPTNYFTDVEQVAFNPGHLPPGIEPSPGDLVLQCRIFVYGDTQRHRIGTNFLQLPVNCPFKTMSAVNYQRDGSMALNNQGGAPKYFPNSFNGPVECPAVKSPRYYVSGEVDRHYQPVTADDYVQPGIFWRRVLQPDEKTRLVRNIAGDLKNASTFIIERAVENFANVDRELGTRLIDELRKSGASINACGKSAHL